MKPLDKNAIRALLPHTASMVLLDTLEFWSPTHIVGSALSHRKPDNPLRIDGRLDILAGIEYAAQAVAAHARLLANTSASEAPPKKGYIAGLSKLECWAAELDSFDSALRIEAERLEANGGSSSYAFCLTSLENKLLEGRMLVVLAED